MRSPNPHGSMRFGSFQKVGFVTVAAVQSFRVFPVSAWPQAAVVGVELFVFFSSSVCVVDVADPIRFCSLAAIPQRIHQISFEL